MSSTSDVIAGNDATCNPACPTIESGHLGGGLRLDGIDDCLEVADRGQLALPQVTLSVWSNVDALDTNQTQLAKRFDTTGVLNTWQLELTGMPPEQSLTTYHGGATNDYTRSSGMPRVGVWQHVVGTYDGATLNLYVDGVLVAFANAPQPLIYDTNPLRIGCDHNNNSLVGFFRGVLDEVRIYDRVLDLAEITALP